ncbi:hypothetical protein AB447_209705 [Bacillus glycinifermentans]|uniref:Uncharacterized protein n=1 Tax=Bacillus glycinifermentans TaxID=1664069 RepID=A0A0T6BUY9_9BACI|nr:hypothetical protein AB447_209705 [Bacillus glycinifermentans]
MIQLFILNDLTCLMFHSFIENFFVKFVDSFINLHSKMPVTKKSKSMFFSCDRGWGIKIKRSL